jgi:hypothetical protein
MFFLSPLFSHSPTLKNMQHLQKKQKKVCDLFNSSYLVFILLVVLSFIYICFQFNPLSFDFSIEFILLFYDVLGLILNILITNLDSWIFYQILISFQFHPWIHDFIFLFFHVWSSFSWIFIFVLNYFVSLIFLFNFDIQFNIWWYLWFDPQ